MMMPDRDRSSESTYRFSFIGSEFENPSFLSTEYRLYNPTIGRWLQIDPKAKFIPFETPYSYSNNMPILGGDPDGDFCVPCVIILIGFLTAPSVAVAPTGNKEIDGPAINAAYNSKANWVLNSVLAGGVATGALGKAFLTKLSQQYALQVASTTFVRGWKEFKHGEKVDFFKDVLVESFQNLDLFDAYLGTVNMNSVAEVLLAATVDITPEESAVLGYGKDVTEVSIDAFFGILSEYSDTYIAKGRYGIVLKEILSKADDVLQQTMSEELKNQMGEDKFQRFTNDIEMERIRSEYLPQLGTQDNTKVVKGDPTDCIFCK